MQTFCFPSAIFANLNAKWYLSESRFHENCFPLDVNKHQKCVLFSTAMKLLFFFQMFENHLLARILFLVDMTESIDTAFDNYYSNVFQGLFFATENWAILLCLAVRKGSISFS